MSPIRSYRLAAAAFALGVLSACERGPAPSAPPRSVLQVREGAHAAQPAAASGIPAAVFGSLADRVLDGLLADDPANARELGLHEYDGKVAPMSKDAIRERVARLNRALAELGAVDPTLLSADQTLDLQELRVWVALERFFLADVEAPRRYPQTYEPLFTVNLYVDRDYAPLEERARRLVAHEAAALAEVVHVRENLIPPLSKPVTEVAARDFAGFATYLRGDVVKAMASVGDAQQRERFARTNEALAKAADELASWLKKQAARGDQSHVLGARRFMELLQVQEGLQTPLAEFERMNEENLAENKRAFEELAVKVRDKPVVEADYLAAATRMTREARAFVIEHQIVSLASEDDATVRETPPYKRWNAASMEMSGPFESARSAYYYLTFPDKSWPDNERQAYLGSLGDLLGTTIHELYPGHFVQGRWVDRAPTRVQKAFANYAFVEGWAHYTEQMMIDEGFGRDDPANRLAMLRGALLRNCRFAAAIGIHAKGETVEQAAERFATDCHQDAPTAREQAVRGTFDPGYFAYTLGKLQIMQLRQEAARRLGGKFSLRRFHDVLLSHGAPPLALVRDRVLSELEGLSR